MDEHQYKEPSRETRVRVQGDKDTAQGEGVKDVVNPPWKVGDVLDGFELKLFLGKGTSGFVYRAFDSLRSRHCALKLLLNGTPEDLVRNKLGFRRMMTVQHPSLLRVERIHQLGQYIALSMEEVEGQVLPLAIKKLRERATEDAYSELLKLTRQFAAGLATMHGRGLVHRDIKPRNLMVDSMANGRVIDYGLVGTFDPESDPHGFRHYLAGTPRYFAPEVLWDQYYLPAGDIFSLGVVMLEALHRISQAIENQETKILRSDRSPRDDAQHINAAIEELDQSVPGTLREMCLEMLQREPSDRPTAMRVARLGLSTTLRIGWPQERPFIGRESELEQAHRWIEGVFAGQTSRLHITGPSGIGKTRFVDDVEQHIRSMRWGQVFRATCQSREDQPLQAFDQLCDAVANRYKRGDREPIHIDPVSTTLLHNAFRSLKSVVHQSTDVQIHEPRSKRVDLGDAIERLTIELRRVGPLILIIDNAQWADQDSLTVLDQLQESTGDIGLGIITITQRREDSQRVVANEVITLKPLDDENGISLLSTAAKNWHCNIGDGMLRALAAAAAGNPFRLNELADEFRPGGALSDLNQTNAGATVNELGEIDWLWKRRANRLSEEARQVLRYVVTAGRDVSTDQLGKLTALGDAVDAAISELAQQRLVTDKATGGECIQIVHDRVASGLIKTLTDPEKREAHHDWATLLVRESHAEKLAARIASHFFAAHEPGRAVSYAVLAAEDAERRIALSEAARWHAMVIEHTHGKEKVDRIRHAARCYRMADHPHEASQYYQLLAQHVEANERIECQIQSIILAIRSGKFTEIREQLIELSQVLGIPQPRSSFWGRLSLFLRTGQSWAYSALNPRRLRDQNRTSEKRDQVANDLDQQRLELFHRITGPISMIDNIYCAELSLFRHRLAMKCGTVAQQSMAISAEAVFRCYDSGVRRTYGEMTLLELRTKVQQLDDPLASGELWSAIAFSHALGCRWSQVPESVALSIGHYDEAGESTSFDVAYVNWINLWAMWNLGRWDVLRKTSRRMFDDATRRNDLFQQVLSVTGPGASGWLARDRVTELEKRIGMATDRLPSHPLQMIHVADWIASVHRQLYLGNYEQAWKMWEATDRRLRKRPYSRAQLIRVTRNQLGTLIGLHLLNKYGPQPWRKRVMTALSGLSRENLPYTSAVASFYTGVLLQLSGAHQEAESQYLRAKRECELLRLRPFQLAAEDALTEIHSEPSDDLLRQRMMRCGVRRPSYFERLYRPSLGPATI